MWNISQEKKHVNSLSNVFQYGRRDFTKVRNPDSVGINLSVSIQCFQVSAKVVKLAASQM